MRRLFQRLADTDSTLVITTAVSLPVIMNTTKILIGLNDFIEDFMKTILNQND